VRETERVKLAQTKLIHLKYKIKQKIESKKRRKMKVFTLLAIVFLSLIVILTNTNSIEAKNVRGLAATSQAIEDSVDSQNVDTTALSTRTNGSPATEDGQPTTRKLPWSNGGGQTWTPPTTKCHWEGSSYDVGREVTCWSQNCAWRYCTCQPNGNWGACHN